jgi:hypothetical protein
MSEAPVPVVEVLGIAERLLAQRDGILIAPRLRETVRAIQLGDEHLFGAVGRAIQGFGALVGVERQRRTVRAVRGKVPVRSGLAPAR